MAPDFDRGPVAAGAAPAADPDPERAPIDEAQAPVFAAAPSPVAAPGASQAGLVAREPAPAPDVDPGPDPVTAATMNESGDSEVVTVTAVSETTVAPDQLDLPAFVQLWPSVVQSLEVEHPMIAALLQEARPAGCDGRQVTLTWAESHAFFKRKVEDPGNRERVLTAIRDVTGASLRLTCELCANNEVRTNRPVEPAVSEEELIARFVAEFDAQELPPEPSKES